jgi:NAD(P)H dehydrogenase (quinone)
MKKILVVLAHPSEQSLNASIAKVIKEEYERKGHEVHLLDLYHDKHRQDFLTFDNPYAIDRGESVQHYQGLVTWADHMVFVFPYWWGSEPAILHNWIDSNFLSDFAFHYVDKRPKGLLQGKTVSIFTTSGTPGFIYCLTGGYRWLKRRWKKGIVEFCGMKLEGFHTFGWIDTSKGKAEKVLEKVKRIVEK